ncbi:MAG: lamin tail domain-containing protein, partial [Phycisphaerae bacterium]|nr:lamin tail domain-containing protein [Phycisphaerae bacterium]
MNKDRQGSHIKPALLESLEPRLLLSGSAVISEFMASNSITILDGLGQSSDWIELHNPTPSPVSLNGWFLTDDSDDLDKWMIPNVTLAAAGDPGGDDYLIIFASGQDDADYPYWDGQYHHTNFKLSSNDSDQHESVLLVKDDALTVEHGYEDYPEQVADVSYGMGDSAPIYHELVAVGDTSSYLVPTAGHAALLPDTEPGGDPGWTADTFDDSTWTNTTLRDQAGMIITEIDSGTPNFVEIQNVSDAAIDTAGWSVLVNDASVSISSVNALEWDLPSSVSPSEVLYRSDDPGDASHYWGGAIDWVIGQDGWAMIVDDTGDVVDFVVWGYSSAEINDPLNFAFSYEVSPGVFVDIDAYGEWSGDGAIVGDGTGGTPGAQQDVVEFGDSWYYMHPLDGVDPAIADTDFNSTWTLPVGYDGPAFTGPNAAMLGFGTINSGGGVDSNIGTPPSGSRRTAYFRRELVLSDELVSAGIEILSDDGAIIYIDGVEVARNNISASDTYMAMASGSSYADNGSPTENETRTLAISDVAAGAHWISVSVHQNSTGSSDMGFDMRLFGQLVPDPGQVLKRSDNGDDDVAEDFLSTDTASMGLQNSALTVPFGITAPARTGLGFSADQPEFDSLILTDVGSEMQGVNASLWTRIDFNVASTSLYDTLTLRMKYNDGFVAYLNGSVVAWRNAPGTLAWDSSAASTRSDANSVVFEDIDITEHLFGALRNGPNVLAIHALNTSPADSNLLIVPELVATSDSDTQYMSSPSPDGANSPGALGLVADTEFSVDRGFYESPQVLAITSDTLGASIRYTLDGTKPTESHGTLYTTPIDITTTTTLRAIAYFPGYISSNVDTQTYIFPYAVVEQTGDGFPDDWGVVAGYSDYEIDPEVVGTNAAPNPTYYDDFIEGLTAIPTLSVVLPVSDIFANGGLYDNPGSTSMEREASAELIYPDGSRGFQIDAGLKMQGGASRSTGNSPKHSMSLRFRQQYGPGHLDFPLYDGSPVDSFNSLQLRAVYNNSWIHWSSGQRNVGSLIRDQWARDALLAMGQEDAGQGVYVHLYIDGLYWGVHMLQERQEASHYAAYHGGDEDTIDALNSGAAIDGTTASWLAMHNLVAVSATDGIDLAEFQAIQQKLDVVSFIDYMMVNQYAFNADWDGHNWRAAGGGTNDAPWRVYSWDAERILETGQLASNRLSLYNSNKPSGLFQDLRQSPEFNLMFADRIHKHFYNDGVFTPDRAAGLWMDLADQLDQAIVAESARWGDYRRDVHVRGSADLYTRDGHWYPQQQALMDSYFYQTNPSKRRRDQEVLEDYVNASLYPAVDAPVFYIEGSYRHGGAITSGDLLTIVDPSYQGIIYYTLDGTDPRLPGGSVNTTSAITYGGGTLLNSSAKVMSRVLKDGVWSALNEATYDVSVAPTIAITEINYNPYDPTVSEDLAGYEDAEDFEFVEIRNIGAQTVDLRTVHFSDGIEFDFTRSNVTSLAAGDYAVVVRSTSAFQERYGVGISIAGEFGGFLSSGGEGVELAHGGSSVFLDFNFNDTNDWPGRADGKGASLEIVDPLGDYSDPLNWRSSVVYGGTPGRGPELPVGVVINEVLTHTDLPLVDSIELHNTTAAPVDIGGWFLSDTWGSSMNPGNGDYKKYTIAPGTSIPTGGYLVLDEDDFNSSGGVDPLDFALSGAHGDDVWLMVADGLGDITYFADHVSFPATDNGESLGRWPDGSGALYPMLSRTLGSDNSTGANGPRVGPVIISEVMYHPPYAAGDVVFQTTFDTDSDGFAYIDDAFNGTSNPAYASGVYDPTGGEIGGGLSMYLGPGDTGGPTSGAASRSVTLSTDESLDVSFRYRLMTSDGFEFNEYGDVILEVDGVRYGGDAGGSVVRVIGPAKDTGWDTARFTTSGLLAGPHTVSIGVYNNRASGTDEFVELFIDDVEIYVGTGSPLPDDLEFIELYNPTAVDIPLAAWTENPHAPGQYFADWRLRGGVDMEFDPGTTIGAQSMLVILSFDPNKPENASRVAGFRSYYGIDTSVPLAGGYEGKLSNNSERITLQRPDSPPAEETSFVPHVLEDQVIYDDLAPWATSADGLGDSLQRTPINGWGDDPANWIAGTPDPGAYASINNSPVVDNPIVDVTVDEDAVDTVVDLSATFSDPDLNTFTLSVTGNTDAGLVAASMNVDQLTLSYLADQNGSTDITIRATDTLGAWTEDTFTVTVNPTPDPPTLNNPVAD